MKRKHQKEKIRLLYYPLAAPSESSTVQMLEACDDYLLKQGTVQRDLPINEIMTTLQRLVSEVLPDLLLIDLTGPLGSNDRKPAFHQSDRRLNPIPTAQVDTLSQQFLSGIHIETATGILFPTDPGVEMKAMCAQRKWAYLISPFSFTELDCRIKERQDQKLRTQHVAWQDRRMAHAVVHIDKLKGRIQAIEKRFNREKELLHNSLKQINEMSRERTHLKNELRESRQALSSNIKGLYDFLSSMVDSRNDHRRGHSRRVSEIALYVADQIGLEDSSKHHLRKAAMLHEVGMLLISDRVLEKDRDALTQYERDMLDLQFLKGAEFLQKCPGFEKTADIVRHMNENVDGTGYPEGLKKRYIPLISRVLTGADMLDQFWMDYFNQSNGSDALVDHLLEELEEVAGVRIDPAIVNYLEKYVVTVLGQNQVQLRELAVSQLKPGMVIGTGLFTRTGTKLLTPGTRLTKETIDMMIRYNREYPVDETVFIKVE